MLFPIDRHLLIQNIRQNLGCKIDNRHGKSLLLQIFRHFQTDKSGSDYHRLFYAVVLNIVPYPDGIVRCPHRKHPGKPHSFYGRYGRRCSYRND